MRKLLGVVWATLQVVLLAGCSDEPSSAAPETPSSSVYIDPKCQFDSSATFWEYRYIDPQERTHFTHYINLDSALVLEDFSSIVEYDEERCNSLANSPEHASSHYIYSDTLCYSRTTWLYCRKGEDGIYQLCNSTKESLLLLFSQNCTITHGERQDSEEPFGNTPLEDLLNWP